MNNSKEADKYEDGKLSIVVLGEYARTMTTTISKEIGHSQTPLIINFGKDSQIDKSYFTEMVSMLSKPMIQKINNSLKIIFDVDLEDNGVELSDVSPELSKVG